MTRPPAPDAQPAPWWQSGVIYQIYPRSFQDSNGDGIGDLPGITSRLGYLQSLGIDALWLSPIYPSPMADFGYDVSDYTGIHPDFGTLDDFDTLVREARAHGLRVLLDFVPNHSSDQHPWFLESRASRTNPKRDWYIWRDPAPGGGPPNNWRSYFGGSAWQYDDATGQYYLHTFLVQQPELNWRNPAVRAAIHDALRFWLRRGVSGFRVDVVEYLMKDAQFRDDPPNPAHDPARQIPRFALSNIHSVYRDDVYDVIRELRAVFDEFPGSVFIGETSYTSTLDQTMRLYGSANDGLHLPFHFGLINLTEPGHDWTADSLQALIDATQAALPPGAWPNIVFANHDKHRLASRFGPQARLAQVLLLTLRGTPFIYYGDELGMLDVPIADDMIQDPFGKNVPGQSRDPYRTPMAWSADDHGGFTAPKATPWLPLHENYTLLNVDTCTRDADSMLNMVRALLALRRATPALALGGYTRVDTGVPHVIAYTRTHADDRVLVALNFTLNEHTLALGTGHAERLFSTRAETDTGTPPDLSALPLAPYEAMVLRLAADARATGPA